jgi:uncharacterized SAM-binding protein YcdF (DUF218 family)
MLTGIALLGVTFTPVVPWTAKKLCARWTDSDGDILILLIGSTVSYPGFPSGEVIGPSTYWRMVYAVDAWRAGHFSHVLVSGKGSAETVVPLLTAYGVPRDRIIIENASTNTRESAQFAKPLLAGLRGKMVLLTSDYHMFRASRCFARENLRVIPRPIPDVLKRSTYFTLRWESGLTVAQELVKIAYYKWRGWLAPGDFGAAT